MHRVLILWALSVGLAACTSAQPATSHEAKPVSLFNGKDFSGWKPDVPRLDSDSSATSPFTIRNGMIVSLGTPKGSLISDGVYQNYRLELQYRFADKPGNCGVLVYVSDPRTLNKLWPKSIEVQMMHENAGDFWCIGEDITVPDMEKRRGPKETWSTMNREGRRILNLTDHSEKPAGEWNTLVVECLGNEVKVWVNGDLVNHGTHATASKGRIALQSEASEVEFRKVEITPIRKFQH